MLLGSATDACYAAKAASYAYDYRPPPDDVQLLFFSVETSVSSHGERSASLPPPTLLTSVTQQYVLSSYIMTLRPFHS